MNIQKGLLAGSTALGLLIGGAVQASAADAAAPAPKVEERTPVYACKSLGFWELPGTDICFKVGGYAKANFVYSSDENILENSFAPRLLTGGGTAGSDSLSFHASESRFNFDARSFTEYGTVRAYIEGHFFTGNHASAAEYGTTPTAFNLRHAYVQVGNLLAGQFWSNFVNFDAFAESASFTGMDAKSTSRLGQIRWTQQVGNGVSVAISLENPESPGTAAFNMGHAGDDEDIPSAVLAVRVRQSWGSIYLGGVLKEVVGSKTVSTGGAAAGAVDSELGWAVHGSVSVKLPFGNNKSRVFLSGIYSDGGSRYHDFSGGTVGDAFWLTGAGGLTTVESWGFNAGTQLWVSDTVRFNFHGSYSENENLPAAMAAFLDHAWQISGNVFWSPVPRLDVGLELNYGENETQGGVNTDGYQAHLAIKRSF